MGVIICQRATLHMANGGCTIAMSGASCLVVFVRLENDHCQDYMEFLVDLTSFAAEVVKCRHACM